jgi:pimeloyl-ACP methyl ester carboxylesterase
MAPDLAARDAGSGPAIVLLHGQPGSSADWEPVATLLEPEFRVVVPDRPGYGDTGGDAFGISTNADAVAALMDRLDIDKATVVGHSWGGAPALAFAKSHADRVDGLVLVSSVDPSAPMSRSDRVLALPVVGPVASRFGFRVLARLLGIGQLRRVVQQRVNGTSDEGLTALASSWRTGDVWRSFVVEQRAMRDELPELDGHLGSIDTVTAVIVGDADKIVPPSAGEALAGAIPKARLVTLEGAGHLLPQEDPAAVAAVIADVAQCAADRRGGRDCSQYEASRE